MNKKEKTQTMLIIGAVLIIFSVCLIQLNFQEVLQTNATIQDSKTIGWGIKRANNNIREINNFFIFKMLLRSRTSYLF